jgi:hypothetical protein
VFWIRNTGRRRIDSFQWTRCTGNGCDLSCDIGQFQKLNTDTDKNLLSHATISLNTARKH